LQIIKALLLAILITNIDLTIKTTATTMLPFLIAPDHNLAGYPPTDPSLTGQLQQLNIVFLHQTSWNMTHHPQH